MTEIEYIVRETGFPGTVKQEIVCELVRCKDCRSNPLHPHNGKVYAHVMCGYLGEDGFCNKAKRREE